SATASGDDPHSGSYQTGGRGGISGPRASQQPVSCTLVPAAIPGGSSKYAPGCMRRVPEPAGKVSAFAAAVAEMRRVPRYERSECRADGNPDTAFAALLPWHAREVPDTRSRHRRQRHRVSATSIDPVDRRIDV